MVETSGPPVPGADQVVAWFGHWPSFHDAEILEINLKRKGRSWLRLRVFETTSEVDSQGQLILDRHAVVTFWLERVGDLELADFSVLNVIFGLQVAPVANGFRVTLAPCYGVNGYIEAAQVSVSLEPGDATE
jgi:Immunity protein 50